MKKLIGILLFCFSLTAFAQPIESDSHFCIAEPSQLDYSDIIVCFNLDTHSHWNFGNGKNN